MRRQRKQAPHSNVKRAMFAITVDCALFYNNADSGVDCFAHFVCHFWFHHNNSPISLKKGIKIAPIRFTLRLRCKTRLGA
nr:MAG TPA: hypothetical protein [Bacteriophage sp.]